MRKARDAKRLHLLLAEDNPADVRLVQEAFREAGVPAEIHVAHDGVEALEYLRGANGKSPRPGLVLLDLNMPRKGGLEVLEDMKNDAALRSIPVLVLTSSQAERDVAAAYNRYANSYIAKPLHLEGMVDVARGIETFWMRLATLPPVEAPA